MVKMHALYYKVYLISKCDSEKKMVSNFFIDRRFKRKIEKDIKKRNDIEDKINELQQQLKKAKDDIEVDLEIFYEEVDNKTAVSTIEYYAKKGGKKKQEIAKEIRKRFDDNTLLIEDTLNLIDWYEQMCKDYNDKI